MICSVYGLGVDVDRPLASLAGLSAAPRADLRVTLGSMPEWVDGLMDSSAEIWHVRSDPAGADAPPLLTMWTVGREYIRLQYVDGVDFLLDRSGSRVWATWPDDLTADDVSSYLLGPILGFVLRLRGTTCLHASAVVIDGHAVLFAGVSGAGKSTTVGAFLARGHRVIADDLAPIFEDGGSWLVHPGYPRLRLWPTAVRAVGFEDILAPSWPEDRRHHLNLMQRESFQPDPLAVAAVYVLRGRSDDPRKPYTEAIEPVDALMALVGNTFANTLIDSHIRSRELDELSRFADSVPIRAVRAHSDADRLGRLCDVIVEDVRRFGRAPAFARAE